MTSGGSPANAMSFSRANPSPRYRELHDLYRTMHEKGEDLLGVPPEKTFSGESLAPERARVKRLIEKTGAQTLLDYGSGKGRQYDPQRIRDESGAEWPGVLDYWGVDEVVCYDPCYAPLSWLPDGKFDGVICTDVLEHCPEEDMSWIVAEIFGYARRFVYASVASFPARKRLPNGENTHCTVRPAQWWTELFEGVAAAHPGVLWEAQVYSRIDLPDGPRFTGKVIGNA